MNKLKIVLFIILLSSISFAQFQYPGSKSLLHTHTGRVMDSGRLEIGTNLSFFTKLADFAGSASIKPADFTAANYWLVSNNLIVSFSPFENFDVTLAPRIYQDTHYKNEYNMPDDIFLTLKGGSFDFMNRQFYAAGMVNFRFGIGEEHNYPFTEFASGAFEYGIGTALSYYLDPYLPDRSFSAHLNLGWYNHNEAGTVQYKMGSTELKSQVNSTELQYGLGLMYPMDQFEFMLELNGIAYLQQPDTMVYSRENYTYITPTIRYKATDWISMDLGLDFRISGDEDETKGVRLFTQTLDLPNYSSWKINLGINIRVLPIDVASVSEGQIEKKRFNKRVEFFQSIIEEREKAEDVKEELDKLQLQREEAEKELEELKQILEEQG